ncbi:MAG: 3-deoxy-D-manno-octulosonic acid transferase [Rhodanobacteraceae bacterium]|nr:MAG: 3-deoxy-D-manno-octulosonic acid transferase [Rhodanobacteraceae bacterium]
MRFIYTVAMYIATPLIVWRLALRGLHYRGYFRRWRERFGRFPAPPFADCVWVHAVSVGEVNAALPLIQALMRRYAPHPVVVTTVTPTGSERVRELFGDAVFHVYLPYDLPRAVERFLDRIHPILAVVLETEIWPNLFHQCGRRGIPLAVVNARLSERSLRGYRPIRPLVRGALANVALIAAQSHADARRYRALGAPPARVHVSGNLKFDFPLPKGARQRGRELREGWGATRPVWIAASTHEGEELAVLEAHIAVLARVPDALLLIAPRHPERFRAIAHTARNLGFAVATHGAGDVDTETQCLVIDAMGVLMPYFAAADLAFVAGSLVPVGGHNVLEPAALSKPVLVGPYTFNFEEITRSLIKDGGARRVASGGQLGAAVLGLLLNPERLQRMSLAAHSVCTRERGAARRTMVLLGRAVARARYARSCDAATATAR